MKILITKRNIILTPAPKRDKKNGLKLYLQRTETYDMNATNLPVVTTDLIKGKRKYSIHDGFIYTIKGISY